MAGFWHICCREPRMAALGLHAKADALSRSTHKRMSLLCKGTGINNRHCPSAESCSEPSMPWTRKWQAEEREITCLCVTNQCRSPVG